jgi:hypothetical protein
VDGTLAYRVGPPWPLPNPLWWSPGLPKCGFPSSNHSRVPRATWIGFLAPAQRRISFSAGSQERVPLVVCLVFHRWSGHGEVELELLVFRGLSSESAADCFALSPQERITPIALR